MSRGAGYVRRQGDTGEVDVGAVEALLVERTVLRRQHDYEGADAARDRLTREHGVTVYDRDNEWFVGGFSRGGRSASSERPGGGRIADYARDPHDTAEVDVGAVEALLDERSRLRERRAWNEADAVRDRLEAEHGVVVRDKDLAWSVGGGGGGGPRQRERGEQGRGARGARGGYESWGADERGYGEALAPLEVGPMPVQLRLQTEYGILGHDYTRVEADATPLSTDDFEPINGLLAARLEAKRTRRYDEADALQEMLTERGVAVEDNARLWRADGVLFDPRAWTRIAGDGDVEGEAVPTGGYAAKPDDGNEGTSAAAAASSDDAASVTPTDEQLRAMTVPELKGLLRERNLRVGGVKAELVGRLLEDAATPDEAPDEAADEAVSVASAPEEHSSSERAAASAAVDVAAVERLIEARGEAKQAEDYPTADELVERLRSEHCVVLDDKRRTWRVVVQYGGYYRVGPQVDPYTTRQVGDLLERRTACQQAQAYDEADAIHAQLTEMGVALDTRIRTWKRPASRERERGRTGGRGPPPGDRQI